MSVKIYYPKVIELCLQYPAERNITPVEAEEGTVASYVKLGKDIETGDPVYVGDNERYGGFYILGESRTGKSHLIIFLALQDIERGYGLLFIDPHSDAIEEIIARMPERRKQDVILLDPFKVGYPFGINLLVCPDPTDLVELTKSYRRVMDVFIKVFGDENEQLGVWLEKYLHNSIYALLENQGYTIAEIPMLLENRAFRQHIASNIKINREVAEFWLERFERLSKKDREEQVESTLNRLNAVLGHPLVKNIVGQTQSTINFSEIMQSNSIVLLKMSRQLPQRIQTLLGTILISQLLNAAYAREELPETDRRPFALYCDEFQNFATPDFAKLFTETGKHKVMPAVAHQDRVGQLRPNDPNRGATLAAAGKALFRLSVLDSAELAPGVAKLPPTETRLEPQPVLLISQEPVSDLLRVGHPNPTIHNFVNRYLRTLQDSLEDIKENMEGGKLLRDYHRDVAGLARIDERIESMSYSSPRYYSQSDAIYAALANAESALAQVLGQDVKLLSLHESSKELRLSKRGLDRFLIAIMEGRISQGQEAFSAFLMYLIRVPAFSLVPEQKREVLDLYIALKYGDPKKLPAIPFAFAQAHGLLQPDITKIQQDAEEKLKREKEEFVKRGRDNYREKSRKWLADKKEEKRKRTEAVLQDLRELSEWRIHELDGGSSFLEYNMLSMLRAYILLLEYPDVEEVLKPYYTARLAPPWRDKFPKLSEAMPFISDYLERDRRENAKAREFIRRHNSWIWRWSEQEPNEFYYSDTRFKDSLLDAFQDFLERLWEGALVVYILLKTTNEWVFSYRKYSRLDVDMQYPGCNMLYLPAVEYREPLEIALTLERLSELVAELVDSNNNNLFKKEVDYTKYYWRVDGKKDFEIRWDNKLIIYPSQFGGVIHKHLEVMRDWRTMRDDLQLLRKEVEKDRKLKLPHEIVPVFNDYMKRYGITDILFPYTPRFIEMVLTDTAKRAELQKKVTAGILRDTFVVRCLKRGEGIENVLIKIGLSLATGEDAKEKYLSLSKEGI